MILKIILNAFLLLALVKSHDCDVEKIQGKWIITDFERIRYSHQIEDPKENDFITLFGIEAWSESKDKYFEFTDAGIVKTDIMTTFASNDISAEELKELPLYYTCDSNLVVAWIDVDKNFDYKVNVDIVSLDTNKMVWEVGLSYKVTMEKK